MRKKISQIHPTWQLKATLTYLTSWICNYHLFIYSLTHYILWFNLFYSSLLLSRRWPQTYGSYKMRRNNPPPHTKQLEKLSLQLSPTNLFDNFFSLVAKMVFSKAPIRRPLKKKVEFSSGGSHRGLKKPSSFREQLTTVWVCIF